MYRFKAFYKDGSTQKFGTPMDTPNELYFDFDGCMKWEDYYSFYDKGVSTKEILEVAFKVFKNTLKKEYYRIEIINDETGEVIDYIEE
ncbi:MAG: hypothetical protein MR779_00940 [Tenericutes bacterium]|nr:hypothetical protein [Mycoplasmatota bacterium]